MCVNKVRLGPAILSIASAQAHLAARVEASKTAGALPPRFDRLVAMLGISPKEIAALRFILHKQARFSCSDGKCAAARELWTWRHPIAVTNNYNCLSCGAPVTHRPCRQTGACLHPASLAADPTSQLPHTLAW